MECMDRELMARGLEAGRPEDKSMSKLRVLWTLKGLPRDGIRYSTDFPFRGVKWRLLRTYSSRDSVVFGLHAMGELPPACAFPFPMQAHVQGVPPAQFIEDFINHCWYWHFPILAIQEECKNSGRWNFMEEHTWCFQVNMGVEEKKHGHKADDSSCLDRLSKDMSKLLVGNSHEQDVVLTCGDLKFGAHKDILSARSAVFDQMLNSDMQEGRSGKVTVHDLDPEIFRRFLRYLYTGELTNLTVDSARDLLEAGDRFDVPILVSRCREYLVDSLTEENACDLLVFSDFYRVQALKKAAIAYIIRKEIPLKAVWSSFFRDHYLLAREVVTLYCKLLKELGKFHFLDHSKCSRCFGILGISEFGM